LRDKRLELRGDHQNSLGLEGTANSSEGLGKMAVYDIDGFGRFGARFDRAFEEVGENETSLLEVGEHFFGGLPRRGDAECSEKIGGLASECGVEGVQKVGVSIGSGSGKQQGLDVDRAETRGPFEPLQPAREVLGGGELAAAIARQECGDSHRQKW